MMPTKVRREFCLCSQAV